jgi:hypothetical protein
MTNNKVWRPEPLPQDRLVHQISGAFPTAAKGRINGASPVARGQSSNSAMVKGGDNDKEYSRVWEQALQPEGAAIHDFWWVQDP